MARAATASLRALPLRRVLLAIVAVFVLLPLLVFNVVTRDETTHAVAFLRTRAPPFPPALLLPSCLNASLLATDLARVANDCTNSATAPAEPSTLVHFVHVALDQMAPESAREAEPPEHVTFLQFAAVQSVRTRMQPSMMLLHYVEQVPRGVWYTQVQRHLSLHKVLAPDVRAATSLDARRRRQLIEFLLILRALYKYGGVAFSDFNTFVLRDTLQHSRWLGAFVASQTKPQPGGSSGSSSRFLVGVHALQAPANHPLLQYLERELLTLVARDDAVLREQPLEQLVGQLVLNQYTLEHTSDGLQLQAAAVTRDVVVGFPELLEGVSLAELPSLLRTRVSSDPTTSSFFRGVTAFHVDTFDFERNRSDTEALEAIRALANVTAEDVLDGDSLMRALLRFAVGLNTTAELDAHLTA